MSSIKLNTRTRASHFTIVSNQLISDKNLSIQDRGALIWLLHHKENFQITTRSLCTHWEMSISTVTKIIKNLKEAGYLCIEKLASGRTNWQLFDTPEDGLEYQQEILKTSTAPVLEPCSKKQNMAFPKKQNNITNTATAPVLEPSSNIQYIEKQIVLTRTKDLLTRTGSSINPREQQTHELNNFVFEDETAIEEPQNKNNEFVPAMYSEFKSEIVEEQITRLQMQHGQGYEKQFFIDIFFAFTAKLDSENEIPTSDIERLQKRFFSYAQSTMINFKQSNHRYNHAIDRTKKAQQSAGEQWESIRTNIPENLLSVFPIHGLDRVQAEVWSGFVNQEITRKHDVPNINRMKSMLEEYCQSTGRKFLNRNTPVVQRSTGKPQIDLDQIDFRNKVVIPR